MKPKRRIGHRPRNVRAVPQTLPMSLDELARSGGPNAMIRQAEQQAGDQEARFWLNTLESCAVGEAGLFMAVVVPSWIQSLRKRLGDQADA